MNHSGYSRNCVLFTLVAASLSVTAFPALAQNGKKPGGGTTPPPPVQYSVVWLGILGGTYSSAQSANSHGEIVGLSYEANGSGVRVATRFTGAGPIDLNVEMADLLAARTDGPWKAWIADDINELGQITGAITRSPGTWPFIYDPGDPDTGRPRTLEILPQIDNNPTRAVGINNLGEIAGYYEANQSAHAFVYTPGGPFIDMSPLHFSGMQTSVLNDAGQIAFWQGRYTPNANLGDVGTFNSFPGGLNGINSYGDVVGQFHTITTKGNRATYINKVYRAADPNNLEVLYTGSATSTANYAVNACINDHRDVCFTVNDRLILYRDLNGLVNIDSTVVDSKWTNARSTLATELMNPESDSSGTIGFPSIIGYARLSSSETEAFVLIPATVP